MPGYRVHLVGGAAAFCMLYLLMPVPPSFMTTCTWFGCALAGALFPDVDIKSKGQKYFYRIMLCVVLFFIVIRQFEGLAIAALCCLLPVLVRHRGLFHQWWFLLSFPAAAFFMGKSIFLSTLFFFAGALSHIVLDRFF